MGEIRSFRTALTSHLCELNLQLRHDLKQITETPREAYPIATDFNGNNEINLKFIADLFQPNRIKFALEVND
jgi:hypothetical protein